MKKSGLARTIPSLALALLLPLEASHCLWMGVPAAQPGGMAANHSCCRAAGGAKRPVAGDDRPAPRCVCLDLPPAALGAPHALPALDDIGGADPPGADLLAAGHAPPAPVAAAREHSRPARPAGREVPTLRGPPAA